MAFNLFGSLPNEDTGKKPGQNILVLPVKNKNEKIKEKAASDGTVRWSERESPRERMRCFQCLLN